MLSKRSSKNKAEVSGLTVIEVLLVITLLGLLMTAIFAIFEMGTRAWQKTGTKNELLQQIQLVNFRLSKELELSSPQSVSTDKDAGIVAFLTPLTETGEFCLGVKGRPEFQAYIVYYLRKSTKMIYRRRVELAPTASERRVPLPIVDYDDGTGKKSLVSYASGGRAVARFMKKFEPKLLPNPVSQLQWQITAERETAESGKLEFVTFQSATYLRN